MAKQLTLPNTGKHPDGLTEQERAETLQMLEREAVKREKANKKGA